MAGMMLRSMLFAAVMIGAGAATASASCSQVSQLYAQGYSEAEIASGLGASLAAVQSCTRRRPIVIAPAGDSPLGAAGPAPFGAAGPAPIGAAGRAPIGAAGPAPIGAAGPAPIGAAGPAPIGSANSSLKKTR